MSAGLDNRALTTWLIHELDSHALDDGCTCGDWRDDETGDEHLARYLEPRIMLWLAQHGPGAPATGGVEDQS